MAAKRDRYAWQRMKKEERPVPRSFLEKPIEVFTSNPIDFKNNFSHTGMSNEDLSEMIKETITELAYQKTLAEKQEHRKHGLKLNWESFLNTKMVRKTF